MISSNSKISIVLPKILAIITSVLIAVFMWYFVSVKDRLETQLEISIDYNAIPQNLIITNGLVSKLIVRIRGPETLLRSIPRDHLTQSINLSSIKKGTTIVPIGGSELDPALRAFDLIDIKPNKLIIEADNLIERIVSLKTTFSSPFKNDILTVENTSVSPATVTLKGPESIVSKISSLPLVIKLEPKPAGTIVEEPKILETPNLVTATPSTVKIKYTITSERIIIPYKSDIKIIGGDPKNYIINPTSVNLEVEVPKALSTNQNYLNKLNVSILLPNMKAGQSENIDLHINTPEGMTIITKPNEKILVIRKKPEGKK